MTEQEFLAFLGYTAMLCPVIAIVAFWRRRGPMSARLPLPIALISFGALMIGLRDGWPEPVRWALGGLVLIGILADMALRSAERSGGK
ncbi:MAG: hypothetical protein ACK4XJ_06080 [Fimbriimonadaceae bacterium]